MFVRRPGWAMAVAFALPLLATPVFADELTEVYAKILKDPASAELNLQYAMIAEGRKEYRKALAAYERVLLADPHNAAAERGLARMKQIIKPQGTHVVTEAGVTWETNPQEVPSGARDDFFGYDRMHAVDERIIGDQRYRTTSDLFGEAYFGGQDQDLNYASLSTSVGPMLDVAGSTDSTFIPAIGGAAAYFDRNFYYGEGNVSGTLQTDGENTASWARLRAGYRDYDPFFTADDGFYADLMTKFTRLNVFGENDAVSVGPWARWSGIDGTAQDNLLNDFAPGRYVTGGVQVEYVKAIDPKVTVGTRFGVDDRYYFVDLAPGGDRRQDITISPGVNVTFTNLFASQADVRFDYEYDRDFSNDPGHSFEDHLISMAIVAHH